MKIETEQKPLVRKNIDEVIKSRPNYSNKLNSLILEINEQLMDELDLSIPIVVMANPLDSVEIGTFSGMELPVAANTHILEIEPTFQKDILEDKPKFVKRICEEFIKVSEGQYEKEPSLGGFSKKKPQAFCPYVLCDLILLPSGKVKVRSRFGTVSFH